MALQTAILLFDVPYVFLKERMAALLLYSVSVQCFLLAPWLLKDAPELSGDLLALEGRPRILGGSV